MARKTQYQVQRVIYIVLLVLASLVVIYPFVVPILFAGTIALALYPLQLKLEKRHWKRPRAAGLLTALFTMIVSIPFVFFLAKGTMLVTDLLQKFSVNEQVQNKGVQAVATSMRHELITASQKYLSKTPLTSFLTPEKLEGYLKSANVFLLDFFQSLATNIPTVILFLVVMILCTYSFLSGAGGLRQFFQELFGFSDRKMNQLVGIFLRDARQVYISNIVTGAIQSLIVATGVYFVTNADWFLVFFVTLIFSFVPVIGAAPMAFLFAVVAYFQDNTSGAIILAVMGGFTGLIDNILRPWLASFGESKAPGIVSFIFVIGGALLIGFPGLFIGLLLGSIAYDTLPLFWEEIEKGESAGVKGPAARFFSFGDKTPKLEKPQDASKH